LDVQGETVSENHLDVYFYPAEYKKPTTRQKINVPLWQSMGLSTEAATRAHAWQGMGWETSSLAYRLGVTGYNVYAGLDPDLPVAVVTAIDEAVEAYLGAGGSVLAVDVNGSIGEFLSRFGLKIAVEAGGPCESQFVRKSSGLFERVRYENPLLWPFCKVSTQRAILNMDPQHDRDILAGTFGHYIQFQVREDPKLHGVGATIAQFRYKQGRLLVTTFDLFRNAGPIYMADPVGLIMFQDLVRYTLSGFDPKTVLA
jgi:hypothetical protein